jgi:restriction system protein
MTDESSVPIWPYFVRHVLTALADGSTLGRRDLVDRTIASAGLSEDARAETLSSGQGRAAHRIGWSLSHMFKAGWIDRPQRGTYRITGTGAEWRSQNPVTDLDYGEARQLFHRFWPQASTEELASAIAKTGADVPEVSPIEQVEAGISLLQAEVADELLRRLRDSDPAFFEDAVVKVLLAMGYGGAEQRGKRIGGTADGGVDGVIDQDALGLERIYVQAKRYNAGNTVGRETIQAFIGALHGLGANRGVFITTSTFTQHARDYAQQIATRIVLIDGLRLVNLMIAYRVGVQVKDSYHVVEIDEDFFE